MFRFSCFHSPTHAQKPKIVLCLAFIGLGLELMLIGQNLQLFVKPKKKTVQLPTEAMQKTLEDYHIKQPKKDSVSSKESPEGKNTNPSPSSIQDWKSEGLKSTNDNYSQDGHQIKTMRKSLSLGTGLAHYQDMPPGGDESSSSHNNRSDNKDEFHNAQASISPQISSNLVHHASELSPENSETRFSGGGGSSRTPVTPHAIVKSNSLPYLHSSHENAVHQSRSSEDLKELESRRNDDSGEVLPENGSEGGHVDKIDDDVDDGYDDEYVGSAKDWIVPAGDEIGKGKSVQEEYSDCRWEELPNEDFKIKRIEKWVMDLQHCGSLEETDVISDVDPQGQNGKSVVVDPIGGLKNDAKALLGMDAAKRYISGLGASATSAQLANHGLVVIPFLSAFTSLRALNLSGNSIVRITAGALPRGLHILNLSKNSISTIEGLRELTRLRVLDLSYNRILRIGHGLASCSSLKELYLAGNKISEVEGLHRLLKLNVLDLRFNKLSTTKSLGQLAANYNSLQAISLEGNPAQKNIGDEHLKKFLLGLLPHLAYFNRQSIKSGAMKDSADRAARLGISAHQIERGVRAESKKSTHGRKSQGAAGRGRHGRLPPSGVKVTGERERFHDVSANLLSFMPDLAMRRAHSEGLLRAV